MGLIASLQFDRSRSRERDYLRLIPFVVLSFLVTLPSAARSQVSWQPVGPNQVASIAYGDVTGRVTATAVDPADASGNTVYLGTTGGGVWRSTNAAGPVESVSFMPLTDTLPVFSPSAGNSAVPSLSIGAITVQSGVILAGTGDPNDASDSFYGDGLLRSADNGVTWTLIQNSQDGVLGHHLFTGLAFAGFAWNAAQQPTVVAAVSQAAEGVLVNAPDLSNSVMGLYYSTDAGVTWRMSTILDGTQTVQTAEPLGANSGGNAATSVVWNPVRHRFYAAIRFHGYYDSPDGVTWTRLANQPGATLSTAACPTNPGSTGSSACPIFRGVLAVQPTTGDTFALTVDGSNVDQGLWQDVCNTAGSNCASSVVTFSKQLSSSALEIGNGSTVIPQADYNLALSAVPSGPNGSSQDTLLYVGTTDLFRCSLAAGCPTLRDTTNSINGCASPAKVAPAQHAIAALATSSEPLIYLGNDGGLWRSTDGVNQLATPCSPDDATHFQNLNGGLGSLAEVISFAQHPSDAGTLLVGLGANGTAAISAVSPAAQPWPQVSAGHGGTVAIDQTNPALWYVSTAAGVSIRQCAKGEACSASDFTGPPTIGPDQVADASLLNPPWLLDPVFPSNLLIGTCRVWRGPAGDGPSWSSANAISQPLSGPHGVSCADANTFVRSLAAGGTLSNMAAAQNSGSPVLYAGMARAPAVGDTSGGHLFSVVSAQTSGNSTVWADLATSPVTNATSFGFNPGGFDISSVVADAHDATGSTVYATVRGFAGNQINAAHVYRSVDGGAHWINISSNLPNVPANSIVVDPNDANTLYVATDAGVYGTEAVTNCATANCWSLYGTNLPNAPVVELAAAPAMPTGDGRLGELRAATYGRGIWQIPLLTAINGPQPSISLNPGALNYNSQPIDTASAAQTITVTNAGSAPLVVSMVAVTGDFSETDTCTAVPIAVNSTCAIQIRFLPTQTGGRGGVLTVYENSAGGQATAALSGVGSAASAILLDPVSLSFPSTALNGTSVVENITISNTSSAAIGLQTEAVVGTDFKLTANTCGASLGPGVGCTVGVAFTPIVSGTRSGTLSVTDDTGTQTAALSGVGTTPATDTLSPLALTFGVQQIDTSSAAQQIVLSNAGDVALTLIAAQTTGEFTVVNACGNSLNPHSSCSINIFFAPKDVGPLSGVLTVSDQYRTQTIALNGMGTAPSGVSLAPFSTVAFPPAGVGTQSAPQTITLTNNVGAPLSIQGIALTGDFVILQSTSSCGVTVAVDAACTMQVAFTPTAGGPQTGSLTVTDSSGSSPQALSLTGTGVDFALSTNGIASVTISSGQNAVFPLLLASAANVPGTVTFVCSGIPANSTCNVTPSPIPLGSTTTVSVTVLTGVSATSASNHPVAKCVGVVWFAVVSPCGLLILRRRRRLDVSGLALLCLLLAVNGCGVVRSIPSESGSSSSPSAGPATAPGTYTVVAAASSAGLTRSVNLTLIVQ